MDPEDWDAKKRIKLAVEKYMKKNVPTEPREVRYNGTPEKDLEKDVLKWLRSKGFHVSVVESKATYNPQAGRYISQSVKQGFVDIVGNDLIGVACFIELKAPGRRSTLRDSQREFLNSKIDTGCFACVVDSVDLLQNQYFRFCELRRQNQVQHSKDFLRAALPQKRVTDEDEPLFPVDT